MRVAGDYASSARLAVWQDVFADLVPTTVGTPVTVTYAYGSTDTNPAPPFYGRGVETAAPAPSVRFALTGTLASGAAVRDEAAVVRFVEGAEAGWDAFDASMLTPPVANFALLATVTVRDGQPWRLAVDSRSPGAAATVPLALRTTDAGAFTLTWTALPEGWTAPLTDAATGRTMDLGRASEVAFTTEAAQAWAERFTLAVCPAGVTADQGGSEARVSLSSPVPNPATRSASLVLTVDAPQHVRAAMVDALGREVLTVLDGEVSGAARIEVATDRLAPGVRVVRVVGASFTETRRLTVVR